MNPLIFEPIINSVVIPETHDSNGREFLPVGVSILSLSVKERKKYLWHLPPELQNNSMYDIEPEDFVSQRDIDRKIIEEDKVKQKETIKEQAETITNQIKTISNMQQDILTLHSSITAIINQLNENKNL